MPKRIVINVEDTRLIEDLNILIPHKKKQGAFLQKLIQEHINKHEEKINELRRLDGLRKELIQNGDMNQKTE
ncbi:TPA: hypothetical protein HA249_04425 [Candidatus Woesearchaeota archaeon]|nr:MAG: hypothetical protein QT07_C0002G0016 [archaeon GW2011_AR16]HIG96101.1 hypothetical protein [Candidatus Woesearchaeota archaeon]HIH46973.1 hypothetical protein [Candidatus Woesearchaeota archaeon]HII88169.1 hypothetical protein [Candidatus Woesearchaeota archaeon]